MNREIKTRKLFANTIIGLGIGIMFSVPVYWGVNPELTQMQVFMKAWWILLIGICATIMGVYLLPENANP